MIITVANQRGGAGKTTTACSIAQALNYKGIKTLLVDADPQASASLLYGADENIAGLSDYYIKGSKPIIQKTEAGDIITSGLNLDQIKPKSNFDLLDLLETYTEYKHIIIDTAPSRSISLLQALATADGVIIPTTADSVALAGLRRMKADIDDLNNTGDISINIMCGLLTKFRGNSNLSKQLQEVFVGQCKALGVKPAKTYIHDSIKLQEAQTLRTSLYKHAPKTQTALDYLELLKELKIK